MSILYTLLAGLITNTAVCYQSRHQNETLQLVLSQSFFDDFTSDFLAPTIGNLTHLHFGDLVNQQITLEGFTTDFNITGIKIVDAQLDGTIPIVQIGDGQMRFEIGGFTLKLGFDYEFITDPPLFGDIGVATVNIGGLSLVADIETFFEEKFEVQLLNLTLDFKQPGSLLDLDGLNDFGIVINNTLNHLSSIVRNRLSSMINEQIFTQKFSGIANKVVSLIPNDIELLHSDFYIEGLLFSNPTYVDDQYMILQLETSIQAESAPYPHNCTTLLPQNVTSSDYQIQLFITDYFLNALLFGLNANDLVKFSISNSLSTTTLVSVLIGSDILKTFDAGMPCVFNLWTEDPAPFITFSASDSNLHANTTLQIQCQKTADDPVFYQVTDLLLGVQMKFILEVTDNMTFYIHIDKLSLNVQSSYNSTVKVNMITLKAKIAIVTPIIVGMVNGLFDTPISIAAFLQSHGLGILDLKEMELSVGEGYAYIQLTPLYRRDQIKQRIEPKLKVDMIEPVFV